jgi:beta-lactam-binding protein with PASTA domain
LSFSPWPVTEISYHKWQTRASNGWSQCAQLVPHAPPPPTTTVPDVLGDTEEDAVAEIHAAGLTVSNISHINNCVDPGTVQVQNPKGGTAMAQGSTVHITISSCTGGGHPK